MTGAAARGAGGECAMPIDDLIAGFRRHVIAAARDPGFVHHRWYVPYHLAIVERIAAEACDHYPEADRALVRTLVWLHDYGKIVDGAHEHDATLGAGRRRLLADGFPEPFVARAITCAARIDSREDLAGAPIEVQILSSADGAAHLVGPFFALWWYEHPGEPVERLLAENRRKALFDWGEKIVLPEIRAAFAARHRFLLEQCGDFPPAFLEGDDPTGRRGMAGRDG